MTNTAAHFNGTTFEDTAHYTCDIGFQYLSEASHVVTWCNGSGNWTSANETCQGWHIWFFLGTRYYLIATSAHLLSLTVLLLQCTRLLYCDNFTSCSTYFYGIHDLCNSEINTLMHARTHARTHTRARTSAHTCIHSHAHNRTHFALSFDALLLSQCCLRSLPLFPAAITCEPLANITFGRYNSTRCATQKSLYNDTCELSCEFGYVLQGPQAQRCTLEREWNPNITGHCESKPVTYCVVFRHV